MRRPSCLARSDQSSCLVAPLALVFGFELAAELFDAGEELFVGDDAPGFDVFDPEADPLLEPAVIGGFLLGGHGWAPGLPCGESTTIARRESECPPPRCSTLHHDLTLVTRNPPSVSRS